MLMESEDVITLGYCNSGVWGSSYDRYKIETPHMGAYGIFMAETHAAA
jgi:hypothetical protein